MIGSTENKQNSSSLSVYIKLQQKSYDKMQVLAICFDNIPSSTLGIYYTQKTSITIYKLIRLFPNSLCNNGYNIILPVDCITLNNKILH